MTSEAVGLWVLIGVAVAACCGLLFWIALPYFRDREKE